ncbi:MAG: redoxin domain-containing protein [Candidatus Adiutrix sp.]|jgi:peroxiredoxin|nr:redoxin domain-containing protein [Candidatus Adiutrix sp.]
MSISHFSLHDQQDQVVNFADFKGKKFFLSFHPLAWTPVCSRQMQDLDKMYDLFTAKGVTPFGVNIDHLYSKRAWAASLGLTKLRLLADFWPHGALAEALGCFIPKGGVSGRSHFLIGGDGEVLWMKRNEIPEQPDFTQMLADMPA